MQRREFLKSSAGGGLARLGLGCEAAQKLPSEVDEKKVPVSQFGRPVRIVSIGFRVGRSLEEIADKVDQEGLRGADIIALPETWRGLTEETLDGLTVLAMGTLARKHRTYVVCPIDRRDGDQRFNSVVLLDRQGQVVCVYDKIYPWIPEFAVRPSVIPGQEVPVFQADFGRVGFAICFDINFPEVWRRLADKGAELVIWPSAYSGGRLLQARAMDFHYYVVSSTGSVDCSAYDITGDEILYEKSPLINVSRVTLDLDRGIYSTDAPVNSSLCALDPPSNVGRRDKLLKEHGDDVEMEKHMEREEWFVLKAKRPGVSARGLAHTYGLVEHRDIITQCRLLIDRRRGWDFAEKTAQSTPARRD